MKDRQLFVLPRLQYELTRPAVRHTERNDACERLFGPLENQTRPSDCRRTDKGILASFLNFNTHAAHLFALVLGDMYFLLFGFV